jgi:DoxX-like family
MWVVVYSVVVCVLAVAFLSFGGTKLFRPRQVMARSFMGWAAHVSDVTFKLIGAVEVLAALGLVLPLLTGIAPYLSPTAAAGLSVVMGGATVVHIRRGESPAVPVVMSVLTVSTAVVGYALLLT